MADIFTSMIKDRGAIIRAVMTVLEAVPQEHDYSKDIQRLEAEIDAITAKKDRLLELSIDGMISKAEFKQRNDGFNEQMARLEQSLREFRGEEQRNAMTAPQLAQIREALEGMLTFEGGIDSKLVTTILDRIIVKKESTKEHICLEIHLKFGEPLGVAFERPNPSYRDSRSKSTTPRPPTRRI